MNRRNALGTLLTTLALTRIPRARAALNPTIGCLTSPPACLLRANRVIE